MKITAETTLRELAFLVCTALNGAGVTAVLSGGGAASVYAPEAYQSRDLDFIFQFWAATFPPSSKPLEELGFHQMGGTFRHPQSPFTVEFPAGPLMIANDPITQWETLTEGDLILNILSPTDSVRDRLAWFFQRATDFSALDQALGVARAQVIDMDFIEQWSEREGAHDKFEIFEARLRGPE